jgi:hypothetical protein
MSPTSLLSLVVELRLVSEMGKFFSRCMELRRMEGRVVT